MINIQVIIVQANIHLQPDEGRGEVRACSLPLHCTTGKTAYTLLFDILHL